ncbi:unnamed protein product [Sphacelaria rigidula]
MVDVKSKKCGDEGCSKRPSFGVVGSKKAEFCSKHAMAGMVDVRVGKCGYGGCSKHPSFGVVGSNMTEVCFEHVRARMVGVKNKKCAHEGCSTQACYGVAGSKTAKFCFEHARAGLMNVVSKNCGYEGCSTQASHGLVGNKAEFCSKHARAEMVDVMKNYSYEGCSNRRSYGVAGSANAESCSEHARAGMVNMWSKLCSEVGCSKWVIHKKHNVDEATFCREHATGRNTAAVSDTAKLNTGEGAPGRGPTEDSGESVAHVRGTKRNRAAFLGPVANGFVCARHNADVGPGQGVRIPLLSGCKLSRTGGKVTFGTTAGVGMKVEMAVPSPTHSGDGMRGCRKLAASSSSRRSVRGGSGLVSSGGESDGQTCSSLAVVPGRLGEVDDAAFGVAKEDSNVKLELGVSSANPPASEACGWHPFSHWRRCSD